MGQTLIPKSALEEHELMGEDTQIYTILLGRNSMLE